MKSHQYEFGAREILSIAAVPLLCLALFAGTMHAGAHRKLLPPPKPILDTDRTILLHQAEASRGRHKADLVLIGDSSCLMDVSAGRLAAELGRDVLNLATLSYLDLDWHGRFLENYEAANPGRLKTVLLLMHPESLRLGSRNPYFGEVLDAYLKERDFCSPAESQASCALGAGIFQGRIGSRIFPPALAGAYGQEYGFSWTLWDYLTFHDGSAIDPHRYTGTAGNPEFRLAPQWEKPSRAFKARLRPGVKLVVALTPSPEGYVLKTHASTCEAILKQWAEWLNADEILTAMPFTEPNGSFASATHLNARAVPLYTAALARAFKRTALPQ